MTYYSGISMAAPRLADMPGDPWKELRVGGEGLAPGVMYLPGNDDPATRLAAQALERYAGAGARSMLRSLEPLGSGRSGDVYRASDETGATSVALKEHTMGRSYDSPGESGLPYLIASQALAEGMHNLRNITGEDGLKGHQRRIKRLGGLVVDFAAPEILGLYLPDDKRGGGRHSRLRYPISAMRVAEGVALGESGLPLLTRLEIASKMNKVCAQALKSIDVHHSSVALGGSGHNVLIDGLGSDGPITATRIDVIDPRFIKSAPEEY